MNLKTNQHKIYGKGLILFLLLSLILTGCLGKEDYKAYQEAALKTDAIQKGAQSVNVTVDQTLFTDVETHLDQKALKGLESIKFDLAGQFDHEKNLALYDIYFYYNDLGNDFKFIRKSETEQYIKIPMFKEYLKLGENTLKGTELGGTVGEMDSNDDSIDGNAFKSIIDEIGSEWHTMLTKENIFVGEKTTIKNEDGDVKATKFTIKPTTEQLALISDQIKESLLAHAEEIANAFNQYSINSMPTNSATISNNTSETMKMDADTVSKLIDNLMSNMTITHYEEVAYVDIDGYVIEQTTSIGIEYAKTDQFTPLFKSQEIVITSKNWGIERAQKFDFPEIDESNSKSIESFDFNNGLNP